MSRRRSISTDISTDSRMAELAENGPLPLLLYTWAIPHADDWGRLTGDPRQFKLTVCPALDVTASEVEEALRQVADVGLWDRYQVEGHWYIAFPSGSWYKYQNYIQTSKRQADKSQLPPPSAADYRTPPPNAAFPRTSPQSTAEGRSSPQIPPSPSPSPSPKEVISLDSVTSEKIDSAGSNSCPTTETSSGVRATKPAAKDAYTEAFEAFWAIYPRHIEKRKAFTVWKTRLKEGVSDATLIAAARHYAAECSQLHTEERFVKHAATFLGPAAPFEDYVQPRAPAVVEPKAWGVLRQYLNKEEETDDPSGDSQASGVRDGTLPED